ncbi:MAG: hypothetical protein K9K38_12110 [Rhodoferax sp.]|nr:hypothetical protein [Rhodoferax sp.]
MYINFSLNIMKFVPKLFAKGASKTPYLQSETSVDDWMGMAIKVPMPSVQRRQVQAHFIPAIPHAFLSGILPAGDAVALLLFALAQMRIQGVNEIAMGQQLWSLIGNPTKRVRARLLHQIGLLPGNLCTLLIRSGRPHLLVAGPDWPRKLTQPAQPQ